MPHPPEYTAIIIGSGFGGLCMGAKLKAEGIDSFVILERNAEFGGTWWANHYPGAACDIPSHLYSFSFAPNSEWTRSYPGQAELLAYTRKFAADFDLVSHIRTGTDVLGASFDEAGGFWTVHTGNGDLTCTTLVSASGALSRPATPSLPGLESFTGKLFHSAQWDHEYDLRGKRVAVIGTGASAIQFIPEIAPQLARLDIFQRTPPWILPRHDRRITRVERFFLRFAPWRLLYRGMLYVHHESRALAFVYMPQILKVVQWYALFHLRRQIPDDPTLRKQLTPHYTLGCKRVLISSNYYPALQLPNVTLHTDGMSEMQAHEYDAIILGTGFDIEHALGAVKIIGRNGADTMAHGLEAYKGAAVAGFPNFFFITGPNTGLGHNSMIYMIESCTNYVIDAIRTMKQKRLHSIEVKAEVQRRYNEQVQAGLAPAVWSSGCKSWYLDKHGKNRTLWPGFTFTFRRITRRFDLENYVIREQ